MKQYQRHVFVCSAENCTERGANDQSYELLRETIKNRAPQGSVKVTRSGCLGACGFGPNIAVYPEGVWYYGVKPEDIQEIVTEHIMGGRVVSRLLFHKYGETLPDEVVRDVVCGMVFRVSEAQGHSIHQGAPYYFCGESCMAAFKTDPASFLQKGHGNHAHSGHK